MADHSDIISQAEALYGGQENAPGASGAVGPEIGDAATRLYGSESESASSPQDSINFPNALVSSISHGVAGNFPERLHAFAGASVEALRGGEFGKKYDDLVQKDDAYAAQLAKEYPLTTIGGNVLGLMGVGVPAGRAAAKIVGGLPGAATKAIQAIPFGIRLAKAGLGGGILGAWQGVSNSDEGDRVSNMMRGAGWGAAFGAGTESLLAGAGSGLSRWFGARRTPATGIDPAARTALVEQAIPGAKPTVGEATGNVAQQSWEEAARQGAKGEAARDIMTEGTAEQSRAIQEAREGMIPRSGAQPALSGPQMGEAVQKQILARAAQAKSEAKAAYTSAEAKGAMIDQGHFDKLAVNMANALQRNGVNFDNVVGGSPTVGTTPVHDLRLQGHPNSGVQRAWNLLQSFHKEVAANPQTSLTRAEQLRQALNGVKPIPGNQNDADYVRSMKGAYDDWISDVVNNNLMKGPADAFSDIKLGRQNWSLYHALADPDQVLGALVKDGMSATEAANWMTNVTGLHMAPKAAAAARSYAGMFGTSSPEWQALRESLFNRWTDPLANAQMRAAIEPSAAAAEAYGPGKMAASIRTLINSPVGQEVYDDALRDKMGFFSDALDILQRNPKVMNPSRSGWAILENVNEVMNNMTLPMVTALIGGAIGGGKAYHENPDDPIGILQEAVKDALIGTGLSYGKKLLSPSGYRAQAAIKGMGAAPGATTVPLSTLTGAFVADKFGKRQGLDQRSAGGAVGNALAISRRMASEHAGGRRN